MVKARDIVAGAFALEFGDVLLLAAGVGVVLVILYVVEQTVENDFNTAVNNVTAPVTQFFGSLEGPSAGQSWTSYLGFGDDS